jgi:hypothetical protein
MQQLANDGTCWSVTADIHADRYAFDYFQGCPASFVWAIPDIDLCAVLGQETRDRRNVFVSSAVHCGLTILVDGIDIASIAAVPA